MFDHSNRSATASPSSVNSGKRVQSWLDSLYHHHSTFDREEKSSLASNKSSHNSTNKKLTLNSIESLSRDSNCTSRSYLNRKNVRSRLNLRKPRYLIKRFENTRSKPRKHSVKQLENFDYNYRSSYSISDHSSGDESNSNLFYNNIGEIAFLNNDNDHLKSKSPEIKANDLEFESSCSFANVSTTMTDIDSSNNCDHFTTKNHSFGILDLENWIDNGLQLNDELTFKVKIYAFSPKDIKIKIKNNTLIVTGKQQVEDEDNGWFKREFRKKFELPSNADRRNIKYDFSVHDHLIIKVPRITHSVH